MTCRSEIDCNLLTSLPTGLLQTQTRLSYLCAETFLLFSVLSVHPQRAVCPSAACCLSIRSVLKLLHDS